jgi:hypothetical protein
MSIVQNFISGWGCYSVYWKTTFAKVGWLAERLHSYLEYQEELMREMEVKGVKLVRWEERESLDFHSDKVFVVYFPFIRDRYRHGYISLEEMKTGLILSKTTEMLDSC